MRSIIKFFSEVKAEFKNISWPKRESLIQLTIVVISISIIVSLILGGFDYLFTQGIALFGQSVKPVKTTQTPIVTPIISVAPIASPSVTIKPVKK
ncbi:MAG TPA: preprotein translocase subunit SecE [Candidatus Woesebacteria bacterium]|nr:preprotein translocase subunit SecE [Candidatus Woesebacteria bacterium]HPJ17262.1 preprotein translocase subunit SecE [Candidatus Woesebacteria bacterium]